MAKVKKDSVTQTPGGGEGPLPLLAQWTEPEEFTGTIYTIVPKPNQGFANFAIADVEVEKGVVKKITLSEPYAFFEAIARLEMRNERALAKLNANYPVPGMRWV